MKNLNQLIIKELELKNKEVKSFFNSSLQIYNEAIKEVYENFDKQIEKWKTIKFTKFDRENHYSGELKNTIFIYHHDHYRGNSSTGCSVEELIHPHINMDDRGYIKGIAVDLTNYLLLRRLHGGFEFGNEFFHLSGMYSKNKRPSFRKSKKYDSKISELKKIDEYFSEKKKQLLSELRAKEDKIVKDLTGLSIIHYNINF